MRLVVVGAGVLGLTCAVRLREAGHDAHVLARDLPPETTSAVAAALWYPYRAAPPEDVARWSATTYGVLARLAETEPAAGVRVRWGTEVLRVASGEPWWRASVPVLEQAADVPEGYAGGWRLPLPVADMSVYLPWLVARLESLGGTLTRAWLGGLPTSGVVVNCTGLAARALTGDESLRPVRGQVLYLDRADVAEWVLDQSDEQTLTYVVPREHDVVVGGTAEEDSYDPRPDPRVADEILRRARRLVPALAAGRVRAHRVGLRPGRPEVRLEAVPHDGDDGAARGGIVHCYGHGGAGVTLSWGCADDVVGAVERLLD